MKRTLLITLDFHPSVGGIATYWQYLGALLPEHHWFVYAPPLTRGVSEIVAPYTILRRSMISRLLHPHWLPLFFGMIIYCKRYRIERMIAAQLLPVGTAVWIVSCILRIPYSVSAHGLDVLLAQKHYRKKLLARIILHNAERIIVNSAATARLIESYGISKDRIEYIYPAPAITPAYLHGSPSMLVKSLQGKKILLTVGRLVSRKGHAAVLRALPGILAEEPDVVYGIVGDGPQRSSLEALAHELGIERSVHFTGRLSDEEIAEWYHACSIFIMTPEDHGEDIEGFGIVYLEAQSFRKPVIGSRTGGVVEAIHDGVTGIVVPPGNTRAIQKAVVSLLRDPLFAQRLGDAGQKRVQEEFQWKHQAEKLHYLLSL